MILDLEEEFGIELDDYLPQIRMAKTIQAIALDGKYAYIVSHTVAIL